VKIYLDAKDLINILERGVPYTANQLEHALRNGGHQLVLSLYSITEIAAPLNQSSSTTNVMRLLNEVERLPIVFFHPDVDHLELDEAMTAFSRKREYTDVEPFVNRFDQTVDLSANPATRILMNYSLGEAVWDLYCNGALKGLESYAPTLRQLMAADRALTKPPTLKANFIKMIERKLKGYRIKCFATSASALGNWIYENPVRCPSVRLGYEVWHKLVKNKADALEDSDMEDYQHVTCLPYVELMSLDRRMCGYVEQAGASLRLDYTHRVFRSAQDIFRHIERV
jgi:hypothetical protein